MINELRNLKPFVHFRFNRTSLEAYVKEEITVYQDTLYGEDFSFEWNFSGGELVSQSKNKLILKTNSIELVEITAEITSPTGTVFTSDTTEIDSKGVTWGTKKILFNNTDITCNSL